MMRVTPLLSEFLSTTAETKAGSQSLIPSPRFTGLFALQNAVSAVVYND
jgi:hypothetical protein